ncbi:MAG: hypothetical protein AB1424_15765 [Thermodesulfobacteriota bacterium]
MEKSREDLLNIARRMANGEVEGLCDLRGEIVDLDLPYEASIPDNVLFLALYLAKRITGDVWENLATDASFDFDEDKFLKAFTTSFGEALQTILSDDPANHTIVNKLGDLTRCLYGYFYKISLNPGLVKKGEKQ